MCIRQIAMLLFCISVLVPIGCFAQETAVPPLRESLPVPVVTEPAATDLDRSAGQEWHRVTLKLVGSMCPACLMTLEEKLRKMPGVNFAKVTRGEAPTSTAEAPKPKPRNASVVLIYDATGVKFDRLLEVIKKELYKPIDVKDVTV
jgi:hypothetical protein